MRYFFTTQKRNQKVLTSVEHCFFLKAIQSIKKYVQIISVHPHILLRSHKRYKKKNNSWELGNWKCTITENQDKIMWRKILEHDSSLTKIWYFWTLLVRYKKWRKEEDEKGKPSEVCWQYCGLIGDKIHICFGLVLNWILRKIFIKEYMPL